MHVLIRKPMFAWMAIGVISVGLVGLGHAEPRENPGPVDRGDWTLSPLRVHTMPPVHYFHTTFTTTFEEMGQVGEEVRELFRTIKEAGADLTADDAGYLIFVYNDVQPDRSQPFQLSIGITVAPGTSPAGKYQVAELSEFKCASAIFNGALQSIPFAYQKHYGQVFGEGHTPSGESREVYLYWESEESKNNVIWLQVGVQ